MAATSVIQLDAVSKTFGRGKRRVQALKGVHLDVAPGQVYGFLGPNGAGKTTTIRILLNLVRVTAGEIRVLGIDPRRDPSVLRKVGAQVESPSFYGYLSGRANLQVLAHTSGLNNQPRINQLLEQVGLAARAEQRVSGYSLGMRQRLGLAAALLSDPPLLLVWIYPAGAVLMMVLALIGVLLSESLRAGVQQSPPVWTQQSMVIWELVNSEIGRFLLVTFAAFVFAGEYQWGTWKNLVPRTARVPLILTKYAAFAVLITAAV